MEKENFHLARLREDGRRKKFQVGRERDAKTKKIRFVLANVEAEGERRVSHFLGRDIDFLTGSKSENERANDANARPLARVEYRCSQHVRPPHLHSTVLAAFNCTDRGRPIDDAATRSRHLAILVTVKSNWIIDHRCVSTRS